ncbi:hypothetical protein [Parachitinimonas caeni]|uniref:Uncharacterized protein n=1 Tax=Parachitinimonas caeni TaxID=3031301 RepID=A0ABT7DWK7_9NEIS|nr:hypothetical protein [Parachitinimonas caeni]MDK2124459.1 hypothetical protein [Parachitinimonas caeni]
MRFGRTYTQVWSAIQALADKPRWRIRDVMIGAPGLSDSAVRQYLNRLLRAGYVEPLPRVPAYGPVYYRAIRPLTGKAPLLDGNGQRRPAPVTRQQAIWGTMRRLPQWTIPELAAFASVGERPLSRASVSHYVRQLERAGYLVCLERHPSRTGIPSRYALKPAHRLKPLPPERRSSRVLFDPNTRQTIELPRRAS